MLNKIKVLLPVIPVFFKCRHTVRLKQNNKQACITKTVVQHTQFSKSTLLIATKFIFKKKTCYCKNSRCKENKDFPGCVLGKWDTLFIVWYIVEYCLVQLNLSGCQSFCQHVSLSMYEVMSPVSSVSSPILICQFS